MADDRFYVKTLRMQNFRCFEDVELGPFDPHFNLLVGENGAGKSSVLVALANLFRPLAASGGILQSNSIVSGADLRRGTRVNRNIFGSNFSYAAWSLIANFRWFADNMAVEDWYNPQPSIDVPKLAKIDHRGEILPVSGSFAIGPLAERRELLLFYDVDRRFRRLSVSGDNGSEAARLHQAYFGWFQAGSNANSLVNRLRDKTLLALQAKERKGEIPPDDPAIELSVIEHAVKESQPEIRSFEYSGRFEDIIVETEQGEVRSFSTMSVGQRALTGLVADIASRAFALNGQNFASRTLTETTGLILIDEIDLHLHPKWQRQILPALKRVFPKIQFFATTHSPQVIGEAKPEEIVLLTPQGQKRPSGSFGMDSNWILECVMEVEGRDPEIGKRIKSLFDLIEGDRLDEAKAEIRKLREQLPAIAPDIVSAEAYIWNLEHGADEAAE